MLAFRDVGVGFVDVAYDVGVGDSVESIQGGGEAFGDRAQVRVVDMRERSCACDEGL